MEKNAAQEIVISTFGERSDTRYFERKFPTPPKTTLPWEPTPRFRGAVIDKSLKKKTNDTFEIQNAAYAGVHAQSLF